MSLPADHTAPNAIDPTAVATPAVAAAPTAATAPAVATMPAVLTPATAATLTPCAMSSDASCMLGSYSHLPMLLKDNYHMWQMAVKAFLRPFDHVRVIRRTRGATGNLVDPVRPTNATELKAWETSEGIAMGVVAGTAYMQHPNLVDSHEDGEVLALWKAIEAQHTNNDSSLRHQTWSQLFGHRMTSPDEDIIEYWRRGADIKAQIDCITPSNLTGSQVMNEIYLFAQIAGIHPDNPFCHQLISRLIPSEADLYAAFLHMSIDKKNIETTNAAHSLKCHRCLLPGHFARECPHTEALNKTVANRTGKHKWKPHSQQGGNSSGNNSNTNANAAVTTTPTPNPESAGVATSFLSSHSPQADHWLVDSGASSHMTSNRSVLSNLRADRRAIRLADGRLIYSKGIGLVRFVSECGYIIIIHDVLFVPSLAASLFASNRFAWEHRDTYFESMEFPLRRWVNRRSGATEFTATIRTGDLAYLNWKPSHTVESANVSIAELHSRLNHMPHSAIQQLACSGSLAGLPKVIDDTSEGTSVKTASTANSRGRRTLSQWLVSKDPCFVCSPTSMVPFLSTAVMDMCIGSRLSTTIRDFWLCTL